MKLTKDKQFKKELKELLKKFDCEIMLEECGRNWDVDYKIVVDFNWDIDKEESPTESIDFGTYIDTGI
jgi:hypothetical protein|tara:strand:- start:23 stop:226 length:204 start_codon:yes stop_codon:yes gene_type:complete